jgi:hypothetical protein
MGLKKKKKDVDDDEKRERLGVAGTPAVKVGPRKLARFQQ